MRRLLVPSALILLAACARTEEASLIPPEELATNAAEEILAAEPEEQELALGEWRESLQDDRPALEFGPTGTEPLFSMTCGEGRGLTLQRHGTVPIGGLERMQIVTDGQARELAVTASAGTVPMLTASVPSNEPLIAELAGSQGPITIQIGDGAPLLLPPNPLIGEFAATCAGTATQAAQAQEQAEAAGE